jgi:hypothetical protein
MNAVAAGVVDHLMLKSTYLTFISTSPTGPALAENFLTTVQTEHDYLHSQQYVNLGYVPGEAAGLISFSIAPQEISPLAFDGADAWDMQPLEGIEQISDFTMVLVITDDPETARLWIEQVGPTLSDTPLMMAVSAQVEPLIRPYYQSAPQQVSGLIAGVSGGASYEQLIGRGNLAQTYWDAFSYGILIAIVLIVAGGVINAILYFLHESDQEEGP